jgi:hypothetical protein
MSNSGYLISNRSVPLGLILPEVLNLREDQLIRRRDGINVHE